MRESIEGKARIDGGASLLQLLVRRQCVRYDQEEIGLQQLAHGPGGRRVPQVRRIEAAAVEYDLHAFFFLSFTSSIFGSFSLRL